MGEVTVYVKYGGVEKTFSGSLEDVWLSLGRFFGEFVPTFDVAKRLVLSVDLQRLVKDCEGLVAFSKEGGNLLVDKAKLTDNEALLMWLLAGHVGHDLGFLPSDLVGKDELTAKLAKTGKIVSTRLGELVKGGLVAKDDDEKFRITTFGVVQVQKDVIPKVKAKMNG